MADTDVAYEPSLAEQALPVGTTLSDDQFTITKRLGAGGFGITYTADDNVLGRTVVIKECFPEDFCIRDGKNVFSRKTSDAKPIRSIVKMFMREARSLAKLRHPNIVGVHRIFEENGTAYMVLDLIEGQDLFDILDAKTTPLSPSRVRDILLQLLDAIEKVHEMGLLHRDISPDNILIENDGTPVLIDFGAARVDATRHTRAVSSFMVVKDGYSPQEFYVAGSEQAPSSDLYALAATFYHVLSGRPPPNPQTRLMDIAGQRPDPCKPLAGRIEGYDQQFLEAIDRAMQIHPGDRLQTAAKWRSLILSSESDETTRARTGTRPADREISLDLELSLSRLVEETNEEVRRVSQMSNSVGEPSQHEAEAAEQKEEPPKSVNWAEDLMAASTEAQDDEDYFWDVGQDAADEELKEVASEQVAATPEVDVHQPSGERTANWIDRAIEKQERIRSERLSQETEAARVRSVVSKPQPMPEPVVEAEPSNSSKRSGSIRSFGLYVGLILCTYCVFLLSYQ